MKRVVAIALLIIIASPAFADLDGFNIKLQPDNRQIVSDGMLVYQNECAACHGDNLEGQENWKHTDENGQLPAPPHDDSGHTWHHADDLLFEITKFGIQTLLNDENYNSAMPVYAETLSDSEIIAVLSYIKSTWSDDTSDWHDRVNESYNEYWEPNTNPLVSESEIKGDGK